MLGRWDRECDFNKLGIVIDSLERVSNRRCDIPTAIKENMNKWPMKITEKRGNKSSRK